MQAGARRVGFTGVSLIIDVKSERPRTTSRTLAALSPPVCAKMRRCLAHQHQQLSYDNSTDNARNSAVP